MTAAHATPSDVAADSGLVIIDGPGGVAVTLTPEAAAETADRIVASTCSAAGQRDQAAFADQDRVMQHYGF